MILTGEGGPFSQTKTMQNTSCMALIDFVHKPSFLIRIITEIAPLILCTYICFQEKFTFNISYHKNAYK